MMELLKNLQAYPPFSLLDVEAIREFEYAGQIAYYPSETILVEAGHLFEMLYIIIKGRVEAYHDDELINVYDNHDSFGGIEHLKQHPSNERYIVSEELICYEIPKHIFLAVCEKNHAFRDYFITSLVERANLLKEKQEYAFMSDLMIARLEKNLLHDVCIVEYQTNIKEAIEKMEAQKVSALLVHNQEGYGIVTDTNLRQYILRRDEQNLKTIGQIQTNPIIAIQEGELLFNVLLLMTQHSIKHLPVFNDKSEPIGILELIDLVSFFSNQTHLITVQIESATTLEATIEASKRVIVMIGALHSKGVKSRYIAKLVSEINKKIYTKLFHFIIPKEWHEYCALILLGSEGRGEQILRTDQDNAFVFADGFVPNDVEKISLSLIEALDDIGFPRCEGNVMVINPKWRQHAADYDQLFDVWVENPTPNHIMDVAIFFDSVCIAGKKSLHTDIRQALINKVQQYPILIRHFAKSIENFDSALGLFSQFLTSHKEHKNEIDIKKTALFPMVHGVRALALEQGIEATNTYERIKELNNNGFLSREDAQAMIEALEVINTLRLHSQLKQYNTKKAITNYISLAQLGKMERDLLKDALKTVAHFRKIVSYHFQLSMVG
ncbi:MAG: cyclic nucleotide-binding/CBS domain-containing protein [Campylobacterales bacterium]|nr:cyclic nucleotide-binding/CBS domain-containing protein [Campylobacterales bacterium]